MADDGEGMAAEQPVRELDRLSSELQAALAGDLFRRRVRLVLPLLTTDPSGFPRPTLLTPGEVRANSATRISVAVRATSRTATNLIRRPAATLLYLHGTLTASIQARVGRARVCELDPDRQIFPLQVFRVRLDRPDPSEGAVALSAGPRFGGRDADRLFSPEMFEELGRLTT